VPAAYGETTAAVGVDGIELLSAYERGDIFIAGDGRRVFLLCLLLYHHKSSFSVVILVGHV
jgi:hypothetical protein